MNFFKANEYQPECNKRFLFYKREVNKLLPNSRIEHIGSSSIPGAISKGDLDIFIGVEASEFENAIHVLLSLDFKEKKNTLRTSELCMLESDLEDVALQVIVNGSRFESFLYFRDQLRFDEGLVKEYNEIKLSCSSLSHNEYRNKKSLFIERILLQA